VALPAASRPPPLAAAHGTGAVDAVRR